MCRRSAALRFLLTAADTDGELLGIETTNPPNGVAEPLHVHPHQESHIEPISGALQVVLAGEKRRLEAGEAIAIPAGTRHRFFNDGEVDAVAIQEFRPALRIAEFFETYFGLAERGELDERGKPSLLRSAVMGPAFADEIRLVSPPWPVQRAAFALLGPIARLRGYRAAGVTS
jgi:quercetin dioxygenase-like cupin family protein